MDDYTEEVLKYIDNFTAYVLGQDGAPAKLPMRFLKATFTDHFKLKCSLQILYTNKYITNFTFYTEKNGNAVRVTSKGHRVAFMLSGETIRHERKRELIINGNNISVRDIH